MLTTKRRDMVTEATNEVASLEKALSEAKHKAALELKELGKRMFVYLIRAFKGKCLIL